MAEFRDGKITAKTGGVELGVTGENSYSDGTTLSAGTLLVSNGTVAATVEGGTFPDCDKLMIDGNFHIGNFYIWII